ncbi:MAG TPA: YncE family protein [Terriglobales bacterium]
MKFLRRFTVIVPCLLFLLIELGCGDQYRPIANPIVTPGGQPQVTHYAYVLNYNPIGNGSNTKIDVSGDTNLQVIGTGLGSVVEAFQGSVAGAIFIANRDSDTVSEFSLIATPTVLNIGLHPGSRPVNLAATATTALYVVNSGTTSVCPITGSLSVISTTSLVVANTVCVGANPGPVAQLPSGGEVYVANQGDNTISVYDPVSQAIVATITPAMGLHQNPIYLVASTDGLYVFVVTQGNGSSPGVLDIINTTTNTIGASVPLGVGPTYAFLDTHLNRLYVTNTGGNSVSVFDVSNVILTANPAIPTLATLNVGSAPVSVTALPNGLSVYVANSISNDVSVVNSTNLSVVTTIPVGQGPVFIASEPSSSKVYTANAGAGTISIINTLNNAVAITMPAQQQDPNCNPQTSTCPLQRPQMILTQ